MAEYKGHEITFEDWSSFKLDGEYAEYENVLKILHPELKWFYKQQDDYQGEWFAIGLGDQWYFSQGSFGSCSGCDWYQSINEEDEAIEYLKKMDIIIPIGNDNAAIKYLEDAKANNEYAGEEIQFLINLIKNKEYL